MADASAKSAQCEVSGAQTCLKLTTEHFGCSRGVVHTLVIGLQGITQGGLTDVADDAGGDFLIGDLLVSSREAGLGETSLVEFILKLAKLLAGERLRTSDDGEQGGEGVRPALKLLLFHGQTPQRAVELRYPQRIVKPSHATGAGNSLQGECLDAGPGFRGDL